MFSTFQLELWLLKICFITIRLGWGYSDLTLRKNCHLNVKILPKNLTFFPKIFAENFHFFKKLPLAIFSKKNEKFCQFFWTKRQVFGNFLTVKLQFSGGSSHGCSYCPQGQSDDWRTDFLPHSQQRRRPHQQQHHFHPCRSVFLGFFTTFFYSNLTSSLDSAWYCQITSLWAPNRLPDCMLPRKLRWFQIDTLVCLTKEIRVPPCQISKT